jgi:5'-nucleotidase / UDP-sugar diphosphatase
MKQTGFVRAIIVALVGLMALPVMATGHQEAVAAPEVAVVNMADLHSAYDAYPSLVRAAEDLVAEYGITTEVVFLINGDLFELGVAVATRSDGAADWEFLERLTRLGTVVINVGNHEFDFMEPQAFVRTAEALGAAVIGTVDADGSRDALTPVSLDIPAAGSQLRIVGVGTDQLNTYPEGLRDTLTIPKPTDWITAEWNRVTRGADHVILATHAGLVADVGMLEAIGSDPRLLYAVGGHDHLVVRESVRGTTYMHTGFKGERFTVADVFMGGSTPHVAFRDVVTESVAVPDAALTAMISRLREEHLTAEDREVVGIMDTDLSVLDAAMWSVEQVRAYTGADVAFLNHTSFGSGLPEGPLERYRFNQFMRFDNDVMRATVDGETLRTIMATANQHEANSLAERSGDFLYAGPVTVRDGEQYDIVTSSWVALDFNQMRYLGTTVDFEQIPDITTKGILIQAMK